MKINLLNKINKKFKELINIIIYKKIKINKNKLIIIVKKKYKKIRKYWKMRLSSVTNKKVKNIIK